MLRLRLSVHAERAASVAEVLDETGGVLRLVRAPAEPSGEQVILSADVTPRGADDVIAILRDLEVSDEDYLLARMEVIAPAPTAAAKLAATSGFSWVEVMGEARANAAPLARYLVLMSVAGVIAALGVIESNAILIVGAMAVSPDLCPSARPASGSSAAAGCSSGAPSSPW